SEKSNPCEEKSATAEAQDKICSMHVSRENTTCMHLRRISRKHDPRKEKSVMTKTHNKICLRRMSQENLTYIRKNPQ
ncbi:hypothetical protein BHE74_00010256, partial [Ensete ventricosum]